VVSGEEGWTASLLTTHHRLITIAASGERTADERTRAAFFIVEPSRSQLEEIGWLIDSAAIRPIVGRIFPLAEARQAYQHKPTHGKTVLQAVAPG
jgi:NADPH:quinone reductase-like Zn-dependent oxidoreductase